MLAYSCWQTQIGVCERHNNMLVELVSILANSLLTCYVVHTHQFEFANISLTCESRLTGFLFCLLLLFGHCF